MVVPGPDPEPPWAVWRWSEGPAGELVPDARHWGLDEFSEGDAVGVWISQSDPYLSGEARKSAIVSAFAVAGWTAAVALFFAGIARGSLMRSELIPALVSALIGSLLMFGGDLIKALPSGREGESYLLLDDHAAKNSALEQIVKHSMERAGGQFVQVTKVEAAWGLRSSGGITVWFWPKPYREPPFLVVTTRKRESAHLHRRMKGDILAVLFPAKAPATDPSHLATLPR